MKKEKKTIYLVLQMSQGSGAVYIYLWSQTLDGGMVKT